MIDRKDIRNRLEDIEEFLLDEYKDSRGEKERDWRTYEQRLTLRMKGAIKDLEPLIEGAIETIEVHKKRGRKPKLTLKQKVILLLLKELFDESNRMMASMLAIFSLLSGIDVSYKTVERLYSDPMVKLAIYNLHVLVLKKKGVEDANVSGDCTGYSLSIKEHYASEAKKRKEKTKDSENGKKEFVYSFNLMDFESGMYVAYGQSLKSEKRAFKKAMQMLEDIEMRINSVRLDRYYSAPSYVDKFEDAKVYIIPKKNATMRGSWRWKKTMKNFVKNTMSYLEEYFKRNNSETGFSTDKRRFGQKISQRREDRINTARACINLWHNMFQLRPT